MLSLDMRAKLTAILFGLQVLKVFPFPVTIATFQLAIGTTLVLFMWIFNLHKRPKITSAQLVVIHPLAIVHTMGNLFTNMSLGKVVVSFTHTIKAMEPFFSILLSAMSLGEVGSFFLPFYFHYLHQFWHCHLSTLFLSLIFCIWMPTFFVVSCLIPIVGGVALASIYEAFLIGKQSFNTFLRKLESVSLWYQILPLLLSSSTFRIEFWSAMASNVTFQSSNVLRKNFMVKKRYDEYIYFG
ncbi:hypothetical protein GIB67_000493 [Kingdonia uniflora]|uniref:Sugar phosphate transporter domain-containing protein n=1 Tax=Kingdonia uniflora TaxID=39325 RepID=A0A7J7L0H2_9MAGN|nr:hypothetical protein GIB67_000493 [Kingdonia uniflora]